MADDLHAIADLVGDAFDLAPYELNDLLQATPLLSALMMEASSNGTTHKYVKQTGAPVVGWRAPNAGRDLDSSDDTVVTVTLKLLDWSFAVDQSVPTAWRAGGTQAYLAREAKRHLRAALVAFEKQIINGTIGASDSAGAYSSSSGFSGLRDAATVDATTDTMVANAGGTTADVASSVWALRLAADGVSGVYRGDEPTFQMGETSSIMMTVNPGTDNKTFPAWYTPGLAWLGVQIGGAYDIGRIMNITTDSGKGLTDLLISSLLSKFPVGFGPTHLVMSRRSLRQLQQSRTTYNPTGAPAPFPTEAFGVPIIVTDSISDTEELVA